MNANAPHLNTDPLYPDPDHTIDRALSALRDAQPRTGLESRILTSLEHRAIRPQSTRFHISAHLTLWTAASAAVLAVASLLILHHRAAPPEFAHTPKSSPGLVADPGSAASPGLAAGFSPLNTRVANSGALAPALPDTASSREILIGRHPERSVAQRRTPVFENCSDHHNHACPTHDDNVAINSGTPTDAQALADLHAPSHPPPPLPLTPQEKLFLRMLRYGNLTELAELNPLVRAQHDADETTAFKTFFPDPPPLEQPLGDTE